MVPTLKDAITIAKTMGLIAKTTVPALKNARSILKTTGIIVKKFVPL